MKNFILFFVYVLASHFIIELVWWFFFVSLLNYYQMNGVGLSASFALHLIFSYLAVLMGVVMENKL